MSHPTVTVLGLGRMGSALARCYAAAGVKLTVWNRSPGAAAAFADRAQVATDAATAVAASELIVLCLTNYSAGLEVMDAVAAAVDLDGKTLVQITVVRPPTRAPCRPGHACTVSAISMPRSRLPRHRRHRGGGRVLRG